MKKILSIIVIGLLLLSGIGVVASTTKISNKNNFSIQKNESITIEFSNQPKVVENNGFLMIQFNELTSQLMNPTEPVLPVYKKSVQIPALASNIQVKCKASYTKNMKIKGEITPAMKPIPKNYDSKKIDCLLEKNQITYQSSNWYPEKLFSYRVTCGRNEDSLIRNFVDIEVYPIQYSPAKKDLRYIDGEVKIDLTYDLPIKASSADDVYDLVIIAPIRFCSILEKLVDHKNNLGIRTLLQPVEDIYREFDGRDKPEKIKYFIHDAHKSYNISYVMLVGGLKTYIFANDREDRNQGSRFWHLPVRYTNIYLRNQTGVLYEPGCPSDLYYADIYKAGSIFDDWDSNGNGIFAEWDGHQSRDFLDMRPDVYVGRLACRNKIELNIAINKIIKYEQPSENNKSWYHKIIGVSGNSFDFDPLHDETEGEIVVDEAFEYMPDFEPVKVYATNALEGNEGLIPNAKDISSAVSDGAGYVIFEGHGNPWRWDTIAANGTYANHDWIGGISSYEFFKLRNGEKLPVVIVGGCHNGLFNITLWKTFNDTSDNYWCHGVPVPRCFSWWLVAKPNGGAIASTGCTGLGLGGWAQKPDFSIDYSVLSAAIEVNFFNEIGQNDISILGQAHGNALNKYMDDGSPYPAQSVAHCITIWELFGDPSLKLGGY